MIEPPCPKLHKFKFKLCNTNLLSILRRIYVAARTHNDLSIETPAWIVRSNMWLINCRTSELEEFVNPNEARYAILSHAWEPGEEVHHDEFRNHGAMCKRGWQKINKTCQLALNDGCDFAWVDTCCINKTSSAELTEAINSMFPWYAGSEICYAYLSDYDTSDPEAEIAKSRWFTRGWTLQEYIAPAQVRFYDKSWNAIGTKDVLGPQLLPITGIEQEVLLASKHRNLEEVLDQIPIARKMAWASKRETTRVEDMAYCLLGIFGVNLPLLYGEGERAFIRLQEEVAKNSNDLSLLAWLSSKNDRTTSFDQYCGVFAQHPRDFQALDKLALTNDAKFNPDFAMMNKGLKIQTQLTYNRWNDLYIIKINCYNNKSPHKTLGIFLKHQGASVFARARPHLFASENEDNSVTENRTFFLSKSISPSIARSLHKVHRCSFVLVGFNFRSWNQVAVKPEVLWDSGKSMFITAGLQDFVGYAEYANPEGVDLVGPGGSIVRGFFIVFGYGYGFDPWITILLCPCEDLQSEVERGNWPSVARLAARNLNTCITVAEGFSPARKRGWKKNIYVKLGQANQGGEPVYLISCHFKPIHE